MHRTPITKAMMLKIRVIRVSASKYPKVSPTSPYMYAQRVSNTVLVTL